MAGFKISGIDQVIAKLRALNVEVREATLQKALQAGAQIAKTAMEAAAPRGNYPGGRNNRKWGPIHSDIIIYKRKREDEAYGDYASMLAGPSKHAFYAYFVEKGFIHRKKTSRIRRSRAGGVSTTVHEGGSKVEGNRKFENAFKANEDAIREAIIDVIAKAVQG